MSSSDSEAFQSADEDFDDDLMKKQPTPVNTEKALRLSTKKDVNPRLNPPIKLDISKDRLTMNPGNNNENEKCIAANNVSRLIVDEISEKLMEENESIFDVKTENKLELCCRNLDLSSTTEEGKIFNKLLVQQETFPSNKTSGDKTNDDEDDGWEFDNWSDDDGANLATKTKENANTNFPIVDNLSSETKPSLMENISKLMPSTSDKFPVLNQLTGNQTRETQHQSINECDTERPNDEQRPVISSNWGTWNPWGGVVSLLSTASGGVATLTHHMSSVIESGIGVPDPEEIAKIQRDEQLKLQHSGDNWKKSQTESKDDKSEILGNLMHGVTNIGNRVILGGLDTLEGIGKKTMTILQDNDPGLLKKKKLLGLDSDAAVLSQILREAKEKTEETERNLKIAQKHDYKKQLHFESLFDEYHGLVHLEALEMLSKQSSLKLESLLAPLSGIALDDIQDTLNEVNELCELSDLDGDESSDGMQDANELSEKLKQSIEDLDIPVNFEEILRCWREGTHWLENTPNTNSQQIHDKALRCLAHTSALTVNKMHKLAELLLIKERHSTANEADALVQMTTVICWHLSGIGTRFCNALSRNNDIETDANSLITSIFLECSNSISYIQKAFQLFIPILQIGAV